MENEELGLNSGVIFSSTTTKDTGITFKSLHTNPWIMKLTPEGKILFNREAYPDLTEDEFARRVVDILEDMFVNYRKQSIKCDLGEGEG